MMKYNIIRTVKFKKDYKLAKKRGMSIVLLFEVIDLLAKGEGLPEKYKDHQLAGGYVGYRECHIQPDWLLIYRKKDTDLILTLIRTGTHADLFE